MSLGFLLIALVFIAVFVFEVVMFVDAIRNPRLTDGQRLLWCAGMLLIHPFVAIAYYVLEYQNRLR